MTTTLSSTRPGLRWLAGGLAIGLLAAALAGPAVGAAQAQSDDDDTVRSISVNGTGRVKAEPDVADVNLGVTKQGEDAKAAAGEAATTMDAVIKALLEAGIAEADIQTTSLSLNPLYDWDENPPEIEGWEASNQVRVTVRDIEAVGDVVDAATAAGATNVNGISFRVEDPTAAEAEARSAAVADAQRQGRPAGRRCRRHHHRHHQHQRVRRAAAAAHLHGPRRMAFDMAASAAPTPVLPGEVELSVNVFIQYEIE